MNLMIVLGALAITIAVSIFFSQNFTLSTAIAVWIGVFIGYGCRMIIEADQLEQPPHPQDADLIEGRRQG